MSSVVLAPLAACSRIISRVTRLSFSMRGVDRASKRRFWLGKPKAGTLELATRPWRRSLSARRSAWRSVALRYGSRSSSSCRSLAATSAAIVPSRSARNESLLRQVRIEIDRSVPVHEGAAQRPQPLASGARAGRFGRARRRGHLRAARLARPPARSRLGPRGPARHAVDRPPADRAARGARRRARRPARARGARLRDRRLRLDGDLARLGFPRRPVRSALPRPLGARRRPTRAPSSSPAWRSAPASTPVSSAWRPRGSCSSAPARARRPPAAPNPPTPELAWPPAAADGLRTYPPRENGGNIDIRDLGPGARLWLPVHVPGALLSVGDLHFAQGDGEVCISAIETGGSATFRVGLRRDGWQPTFPCYEAPAAPAAGGLRHHRHPAHRRRRAGLTSTSTSRPGAPCSSCSAGSPPSTGSTARPPTS